MNTKKQLTLAWTLVVVLAVLLAISGYFLSNPDASKGNISEKQDLIREHCAGTDAVSKEACAKDLQDLGDMLRQFNTGGAANIEGTFKIN
ncbi:MAG: hypothetical protein AAB737_01840 [Patescibacteria group bacterium]